MEKEFNKSITDLTQLRHSTRNYNGETLTEDRIKIIEDYIEKIQNPFDKKVRIKFIEAINDKNTPVKLGTYGMIKGAKNYLGVTCKKEDFNFEALGYTFERLVLFLTDLGLGTCWMAGTFNKGQFAEAMEVKEDEIFLIVSPVGYEGGNKSILAKFASKNSSRRKEFQEVFFNGNFETPLLKSEAKEYGEILENVRLAPSAVNKQPWRILKEGDNYHFYNEGKSEISRVDIGIALCHFHLTALEKGLDGKFKVENRNHNLKYKYVISWLG